MRIRTAFLLIAIFVAAMIVQLFMTAGVSLWWKTGIASALAICLLLLYISVVRPMTTLANGIDLLKGQDFGSRLAKVGHKDADRLVEMFNSMMQSLRNERLRKHEQNSFLSLLIEASPMGIITCDFDGNPTGMNPAASRMMKGELAEAVQKIKPGSTDTVRLGDNSIFKVSRLWFMEMGFRRPFILVESLTDEVYRAEKEAYGKVIRLIAHEVNNTMGGVSSMLDTLATVIAPGSELQDIIESCNERCIGLSRFITSYADVVKIPAPVTSPRDLNECLRRQLPFLEGLLPQGITPLPMMPRRQWSMSCCLSRQWSILSKTRLKASGMRPGKSPSPPAQTHRRSTLTTTAPASTRKLPESCSPLSCRPSHMGKASGCFA